VQNKTLLKVNNLVKYFPVKAGVFRKTIAQVKAVDDVSFEVKKGETVGLVGESGCGKTTAGMSILRLYEPTAGQIILDGKDTSYYFLSRRKAKKFLKKQYTEKFEKMKQKYSSEDQVIKNLGDEFNKQAAKDYFENPHKFIEKMLDMRIKGRSEFRRKAQMIFQDPYSSLNPRHRVKTIVGEGAKINELVETKDELKAMIEDILKKVGLSVDHMSRFPHEFSGGQRQRIGIARALILKPELIVCDEAVSALDVSIQAQILNLLNSLQKEFNLTFLFIAHDLAVVKHISDRVAVMYLGKIVEYTTKDQLFEKPLHPYTVALMSAIPNPDPENKSHRIILEGDVPSPINPPSGCPFHPRCPIAKDVCSKEVPQFKEIEEGHKVACLFPGKLKR
jgi:peptide/nickel transport system ATP-binding protein